MRVFVLYLHVFVCSYASAKDSAQKHALYLAFEQSAQKQQNLQNTELACVETSILRRFGRVSWLLRAQFAPPPPPPSSAWAHSLATLRGGVQSLSPSSFQPSAHAPAHAAASHTCASAPRSRWAPHSRDNTAGRLILLTCTCGRTVENAVGLHVRRCISSGADALGI